MGSYELNGSDLLSQLEHFKRTDLARQELTEELVKRVSELENHLHQVTSDLEDQSRLRRDYKQRAEYAEKAISRRPYVLVLVDADGYIFNKKYLTNHESGGHDAAYALRSEVTRYIAQENLPIHPDCEIAVNVYANQKGLGKAIVDAGLLPEISVFESFYRRDDVVAPKTILVKAAVPARGFGDLAFRKCDFGLVFYDELLKPKQSSHASSLSLRPATVQPPAVSSAVQASSSESIPYNKSYSTAAAEFPVVGSARASVSAESQTPQSSSPAPSQDRISINRKGERVDARLKPCSERDKGRFYDRVNDWKLCNAYFLGNNCYSRDRCQYDHSPIDDGIKLALKHTARQIPCKSGGSCRDKTCYFGHQCPFYPDCYSRKCNFRARDLCGTDNEIYSSVPAV
ncbi:MAG: hypothetical protein Q9227_000271 [Pyrenula ochraceoflavens]